jgi:hypothetical protein
MGEQIFLSFREQLFVFCLNSVCWKAEFQPSCTELLSPSFILSGNAPQFIALIVHYTTIKSTNFLVDSTGFFQHLY